MWTPIYSVLVAGNPWGIRWGIWLLLAGLLILAHGCHGDEDHELLAPWNW